MPAPEIVDYSERNRCYFCGLVNPTDTAQVHSGTGDEDEPPTSVQVCKDKASCVARCNKNWRDLLALRRAFGR